MRPTQPLAANGLTEDDVTSALLTCAGVTKSFGTVQVLKGVDLSLFPGTVTALAGENGAGKSTLMKIMAGLVAASEGELTIDGTVVTHASVHSSRRAGVAIVPQELAPVPDLAIYENLFLGRELLTKMGLLDRRAMIAETHRLMREFEISVDPALPMRRLTVAMQQIVEIIKNTSTGCRILLLDEPTSAISEREVRRLYRIIDRLRAQGVAIVFTTHKMEEIRETADRVVILRDGRLIVTSDASEISDDGIVSAMIGRDLEELFPDVPPPGDAEPILRVEAVTVSGFGAAVSFDVRPGEIVGLAGLVGAGRTELIETIMGIRKSHEGRILVGGRPLKRNDPASAIRSRMAIVPEDRKDAGLVLGMSILDNAVLPRLGRYSNYGVSQRRKATREVGAVMSRLRLRYAGLGQPVSELSGGNQQKVVLGRWLTDQVDVLLLDEPTRGVDVGARSEIYRIIADLAASGMAVVMASSDMPEILGLAHRVLVMREGAVAGELTRADITGEDAQSKIFALAAGIAPPAPERSR